eukprot:CAMPEP_0178436814 /NCGR_PEP_ID=MMETSP0689_2-20121128/34638_1 /TAXON_ID=160604 /ORGANISM="Amphidinium massartii, Strain CS-259" /LENGTH=45 /DNA_ID= /DNA_START= /DNA_END= /DNA_ORIENTATION=
MTHPRSSQLPWTSQDFAEHDFPSSAFGLACATAKQSRPIVATLLM